MKPIAIFRHSPTEGPGYFATYLDRRGLPWELIQLDAGEPVPGDPEAYAGIVLMGGPMSANDDLPWIAPELRLLREAVAKDVPLLGHCLGGQLMAKALGATVQANPVKEIGWGKVTVEDNPAAREWFGDLSSFDSFHWHGETFEIPQGASCILSSEYCPNQAFTLGKHLGMQCHVEMTPELIASWCESGVREIAANPGPSVQDAEEMQANLSARTRTLHGVADRLYQRWLENLALQ